MFGADMSVSVHVDNRSPLQGWDDAALTAEKEYAIYFREQQKKVLRVSITMWWIVIYLLTVLKYKFKAKDSEINEAPLCLSIFSWYYEKDWIIWIYLWFFSWLCSIDVANILDIHKYLMKKHGIK